MRTALAAAIVCCAAPAFAVGELPKGEAAAEGIDPAALADLVKQAEASGSHALVVARNGKLIGEWYFGKSAGPIESMSATKSIVSLAIGLLVDGGKIKSIDQPVADFFPEWRQGRKKKITLRHLLDHSSGLDEWHDATWRRDLPDGKIVDRRLIGFNANGSAGQYLVVYPEQKLVAVRMRRVSDDPADQADKKKELGNFPKLVRKLVPRS